MTQQRFSVKQIDAGTAEIVNNWGGSTLFSVVSDRSTDAGLTLRVVMEPGLAADIVAGLRLVALERERAEIVAALRLAEGD